MHGQRNQVLSWIQHDKFPVKKTKRFCVELCIMPKDRNKETVCDKAVRVIAVSGGFEVLVAYKITQFLRTMVTCLCIQFAMRKKKKIPKNEVAKSSMTHRAD